MQISHSLSEEGDDELLENLTSTTAVSARRSSHRHTVARYRKNRFSGHISDADALFDLYSSDEDDDDDDDDRDDDDDDEPDPDVKLLSASL